MTSPLIILAAGGTGGHIFPAEALARELIRRGMRVALITDPRGGKFGDDMKDITVHRIHARGISGNIFSKILGAAEMLLGTVEAFFKIRALKPALAVGFGGYPSVPTILAAALNKTPILLHDQNAVIGRANKILLPLARAFATSFPNVKGLENSKAHITLTGNPVRPAIAALYTRTYDAPQENGALKILIMGGSLGATVFSDVVPKAVSLLPENLRKRLIISQQCRADDLPRVRETYNAQGVQAELAPFFHDVPERLANCHLAICRSGASTVTELCAAGRPAIFVPYPHAIAGEQQANAECVADVGGGWVIPQRAFTPESLALRLETLLSNPAILTKAAGAAKTEARVNAAQKLADLVVGIISDLPSWHNNDYIDSGSKHFAA